MVRIRGIDHEIEDSAIEYYCERCGRPMDETAGGYVYDKKTGDVMYCWMEFGCNIQHEGFLGWLRWLFGKHSTAGIRIHADGEVEERFYCDGILHRGY